MIKPTIGRKVWFFPSGPESGPLDATVVCVHSDNLVNLVVFDHVGEMSAPRSVQLLQDDDTPYGGSYATWMPYQVGQAAKYEPKEAAPTEATNDA
jgi:hypothetical protein